MVPALVLILALPQKAAQGISLSVMVPMAFVAAVRYWMGPHMEISGYTRANVAMLAVFACAGSIVGALVGSHVAGRVPNHMLRTFFAVFMILVGVYILVPKPWESGRPADKPAADSTADPGGADNGPVR